MDKEILVDKNFEEGRRLISELDSLGHKYPIALWTRLPEKEYWVLMFGIPNLNKIGSRKFFQTIYSVLMTSKIEISINDITLIDTQNDFCLRLKRMLKTGNTLSRIEFFGNFIDGQKFPDSVIYRVN